MKRTVLIIILFVFFPLASKAAVLSLSADKLQPNIARVTVWLDTEADDINAVEGELVVPETDSIVSISTVSSVLPLWITAPTVQDDKIVFAGIVPGGIQSEKAEIFSFLVNLSQGQKDKTFSWGKVRVLLNDGRGTEVKVNKSDWILTTSDSFTVRPIFPPDKIPPQFLSAEVVSSQYLFDGNWAVVFAAEDKGSGIDFYAVQESKQEQPNTNDWQTAASPYLLSDQSRQSYIFIKAVDRAGNVSLVTIPPAQINWYEKYANLFILIVVILLVSFIWLRKHATRIKHKNG